MTNAERFIAALAQAGYNVAETDKPKVEAFIESKDTSFVEGLVAIVEKDFPRQSIEERMAEGPILSFIKNAAPDIEADIDQGLMALFVDVENVLKAKANAGDATAPASSA